MRRLEEVACFATPQVRAVMTRKLIELVNHQPILNLISIRAVKPDEVIFVGTQEQHATVEHLKHTLRRKIDVHTLDVHDPFDPITIYKDIEVYMKRLGWEPSKTIFDLSGGSKMMAIGAYQLAMEKSGILADVERVRHQYRLRLYHFKNGHALLKQDVVLPPLITIEDYLNAHLPGFDVGGFSTDERGRIDEGGEFEKTIYEALKPNVDEVLAGVRPAGVAGQIEIDLVVRRNNGVGIIEAKTGVKKAGIDQLDTAGNPMYMGMYATKFLITGRRLPRAHKTLAVAQQIHVIELPGYYPGRGIPNNERQFLRQQIEQML